MDLHVIGPLASPAERAAVDAVLGPPDVGLGRRRRETRRSTGTRRAAATPPAAAASSCCRPSTRSRPGSAGSASRRSTTSAGAWRSPPAEAYGVATFYALFATKPRPPVVAHVCDDIACRLAGAEAICADLERTRRAGGHAGAGRPVDLAPQPVPRAVRPGAGGPGHRRRRSTAIGGRGAGRCGRDRGPARGAEPVGRSRCRAPAVAPRRGRDAAAVPQRRPRHRVSSRGSAWSTRARSTTTARTAATRRSRRAHRDRAARPSSRRSPTSKLVGRGGAAFPTGRKWAAVAAQPAQPHYLVCNADESEPGTFKDRVLLEGDPFAVVEAMTIAAFATGCAQGLPVHPRRVPGGRGAHPRGDRQPHAPPGCSGRHPRLGLRLRHRGPARRRRLHLRRGDGAVRVDRGQARRAAQQAAVPGRGRAVRQADRRQQRRDAGQRPGDRRSSGGAAFARDRHGGLDRPEAVLPVGPRRAARASTRSSSGRRCAS